MFKKISYSAIIFFMAFVMTFPGAYASAKDSISPNTIITENNINEVLNYLGIDSSKFIKNDTPSDNVQIITVGDLQKYIKEFETQSHKTIVNKEYTNTLNAPRKLPMNNTSAAAGTVMLYQTTNDDGFSLDFSVAGNYRSGKWTGSGAADVSISSPDIVFVRKIDSKNVMNVTVQDSGKNLHLNSDIKVGTYLGVKWGIVEIGSQDVRTQVNWGSEYIPLEA